MSCHVLPQFPGVLFLPYPFVYRAEQEQENIDSKREFDAESGDDEPVDAENEPDAEADADDTELPPELRMNEYDESDDEDAADMDIMDDDIAVIMFFCLFHRLLNDYSVLLNDFMSRFWSKAT